MPGKPEKSEVIKRITTDDDDDVMPPLKNASRLPAEKIAVLKRWIEQGAHYSQHWAYVKPTRPELPNVSDAKWCRNPIDYFVMARLDKEGLT